MFRRYGPRRLQRGGFEVGLKGRGGCDRCGVFGQRAAAKLISLSEKIGALRRYLAMMSREGYLKRWSLARRLCGAEAYAEMRMPCTAIDRNIVKLKRSRSTASAFICPSL